MSNKNLQIWQLARELVIDVHKMTLTKLPKFEMFEEGYKQEFIRFLIYAIASNDETIDHLETLYETESLTDNELYGAIHNKLDVLGKKLNLFIQSVEKGHNSQK